MFKRLPFEFKSKQNLLKLSSFIQKSNCMTSSLCFYNPQSKKHHVIIKNQYAPLIMEDWQAYNLMRGWNDVLINSGQSLRVQKVTYQNYWPKGNQAIVNFFKNCADKHWFNRRNGENVQSDYRQQVLIMTRTFNRQQLEQYINPQYFYLLNDSQTFKRITNKLHLINKQQIQNSQKLQFVPLLNALINQQSDLSSQNNQKRSVLLQFGSSLFHQYFAEVDRLMGHKDQSSLDKSQINPLQLILLSVFEGEIDKKCIGSENAYQIEKYYEQQWRSQPIELNYPEKGLVGSLKFIIYHRK